jgi:hypothetical protein
MIEVIANTRATPLPAHSITFVHDKDIADPPSCLRAFKAHTVESLAAEVLRVGLE